VSASLLLVLLKYGDSEAATNVLRIEYIDSKMTELRQTQSSFIAPGSSATQFAEARSASASVASDAHRERQPAGLGKLQEIDLGPDATAQNIARTEAATRRLENGTAGMDGEEAACDGKVKLGKDGKPWKGRKRRNSEDVKRDMLVEEVLRESRCEFINCLHVYSHDLIAMLIF
jgi:Hepatocellular carcinoma-associated antigen 59